MSKHNVVPKRTEKKEEPIFVVKTHFDRGTMESKERPREKEKKTEIRAQNSINVARIMSTFVFVPWIIRLHCSFFCSAAVVVVASCWCSSSIIRSSFFHSLVVSLCRLSAAFFAVVLVLFSSLVSWCCNFISFFMSQSILSIIITINNVWPICGISAIVLVSLSLSLSSFFRRLSCGLPWLKSIPTVFTYANRHIVRLKSTNSLFNDGLLDIKRY